MRRVDFWKQAHWVVGLATLVTFTLTGSYMRWVHDPPVWLLPDGVRAVYRSRHLFLLWAAVVNLSLAAELRGVLRPTVSILTMAVPFGLLAAFVWEPPSGLDGRIFSTPVMYVLFALAVVMAIWGRPRRSDLS